MPALGVLCLRLLASALALVSTGTFEERLTRPSVLPADQDEGEPSSLVGGTQAAPSVGGPVRVPPPSECVVLAGSPQESSWIDEIRGYLKENILPGDDASAQRIARQSKRYAIVDGDLYRRGTDGVLLKCITRA